MEEQRRRVAALVQEIRPPRSSTLAAKAMRRELWEAYAWFVAAYQDAAEKLRAGDRDPPFPAGCFPPPLPFVGA